MSIEKIRQLAGTHTISEIAKLIGCTRQNVHAVCKYNGIETPMSKRSPAMTPDEVAEAKHLLLAGLTHRQACRILKRSPDTLATVLSAYVRRRGNAARKRLAKRLREQAMQTALWKFRDGTHVRELRVNMREFSKRLNATERTRFYREYYEIQKLPRRTKFPIGAILKLWGEYRNGRKVARILGCTPSLVYRRIAIVRRGTR